MERQHWPAQLWLVRHGQSQGNVARDEAHEGGKLVIDLKWRDVDVPLSDLGEQQAAAAGRWFAARAEADRPQILLSSPYVRARQTADAICKAGGLAGGAKSTVLDERLREREFGVFDGLTTAGIRARYPDEAAHRAKMGKFYHRPPGGESWADVILRLRSSLNSIALQYEGKRVLIVCHQVVVLCMRYILNCGIAAYDFSVDHKGLCVPELALWNHGAPIEAEGASQTSAPDIMAGSR
jgi:probable phosphoglycerate mutase